MNLISIKKAKIFSLMLVLFSASLDAAEEGNADTNKLFQETRELVMHKLSQASDMVHNAGGVFVDWAADTCEDVADRWQRVKESDLFTDLEKYVGKKVDAVKDAFETGVEAAKNIDFKDSSKKMADAVSLTTKKSVRSFKDWWTTRSEYSSDELIIMGGAVVAVITIAGVTYVLYRNGTIKMIGKGIYNHPVATTLSTVAVGLLVAAVYKIYTAQTGLIVVENK